MDSQSIKGRIIFESADAIGKGFFYTTDLEELEALGLAKDGGPFNSSWIKVGTKLHIPSHGNFEVAEIATQFHGEWKVDEQGFNVYGHGKEYPFNFEITYTLKEMH